MIEPKLWSESNDITIQPNIEYLNKLKPLFRWKRDESIFEYGMGDGSNTEKVLLPFLPPDFKEYIGTDVSEKMVQSAKETLQDPRIQTIVLDIGNGDVSNEFQNRFDHLFSFFVMHWVRHTKQTIGNIYKILKPGGQLFMNYIEKSSMDYVHEEMSKNPKWGKYDHRKWMSPFFNSSNPRAEYEKIIRDAGFKNVQYLSEKRLLNPMLQEVSVEDYDEYKEEYLEKMKNNPLNFTYVDPNTGEIVYNATFILNVDVYKKELSLAGFRIVTYERTKKVYEFPNKESFIGFCLSINPILREVSTEDFEEYQQYYLKSMENNKLNFTKTCPKTG
ncbi:unnamed protein product [Phyllotreta striolata]|uniref:Methyltransferase type 12 domain-containing protein n=1 Tax=Phyllotreta striolata TaxID=444603 RepID=A0A9N9TIV1_PHYSR|nr:unnamed protein product [Phyllotreta striolata]